MITDKFREDIIHINNRIKAIRNVRLSFHSYNEEYRDALQTEIDLLKEKQQLLDDIANRDRKKSVLINKLDDLGLLLSEYYDGDLGVIGTNTNNALLIIKSHEEGHDAVEIYPHNVSLYSSYQVYRALLCIDEYLREL